MRLFIGIDLGKEVKDKVTALINEFRGEKFDVNWISPENLHITLKFLGDVNEGKVKEIENQIQEALKDVKPFLVSFQNTGFFASHNFIRVVWFGVKEGEEQLKGLIKILDQKLNYIRKNQFSPEVHITIGRVKSARNKETLIEKIEEMKNVKFGELRVKEIKLKKSILSGKGPVYSDLRGFPLE